VGVLSQAFGGNNYSGSIDIATAMNGARLDFESVTFVCATLDASYGRLQGASGQNANHGHSTLVPVVANPLTSHRGDGGGGLSPEETLIGVEGFLQGPTHSLRAGGFDASEDGTGRGTPLVPVTCAPLTRNQYANTSDRQVGIRQGMAVRRLTPRECERLQGFPDDYTRIDGRTADGPRYKALGNSMAVPVMRWIGERIQMVDEIEAGE
jgi:DNA (cytosine-5)-methyltransferase 1